jgi:hypothetical protein
MRSVRANLVRSALRVSGLPSLVAPVLDPETEALFETVTDRCTEVGDGQPLAGLPLLPFMQWLAQHRAVLFHGSGRDDLDILEPIRLSRDASPFGDQQAVFATNDPVWAIYFASLRRGDGFRGTRNASLSVAGDGIYPRWYFFSINRGARAERRFGRGIVYVVPRAPFRPEPPGYGVLDSAQWAAPTSVQPLFRIAVDPGDFPFVDFVVAHRPREPMLITILRAARRARRARAGAPVRSRTHP